MFRDKIVFVGATAAGLFDVFETPFSHGKMPGIQVHAAVADDLLSNRFMRAAPDGVRIATVLGAGVAIGVIAAFVPAWWATGADDRLRRDRAAGSARACSRAATG